MLKKKIEHMQTQQFIQEKKQQSCERYKLLRGKKMKNLYPK